jgi:hypothetical protein
MCFSPEASIGSAAVLSVMGAATLHRAMRVDQAMLPLASFPLIFAAHQLCEFFVWRGLGADDAPGATAQYAYIIVAFLLWPVLVPLAAYSARDRSHGNPGALPLLFLALGVSLSVYLGSRLAGAHGITTTTINHHLKYLVNYDEPPSKFFNLAYAVIAIVPLLTTPACRLFGVGVALSFVLTYFAGNYAWFSIWCFLAAALTASIYFSIDARPQSEEGRGV